MNKEKFIELYRAAFGAEIPLPIAIVYSDKQLGDKPQKAHCMMRNFIMARDGVASTYAAEDVLCRGGRVYTGYGNMSEATCRFVSEIERYKHSRQAVADFAAALEIPSMTEKYLNFIRIDNPKVNLDECEGISIFANADVLAGLWSWANYDIDKDDAVIANFGSGCSSTIANLARENRINGYRCFIGMLDISVRLMMKPDELIFSIPRCRLETMIKTLDKCALSGAPAWMKVRERINDINPASPHL